MQYIYKEGGYVRKEDSKIIGIIDLRHTLNDFLINFGNCGYSVRPSERNKGYATEMLKQLLEIEKVAGVDCMHLSVERVNEASIRTIIKMVGCKNVVLNMREN